MHLHSLRGGGSLHYNMRFLCACLYILLRSRPSSECMGLLRANRGPTVDVRVITLGSSSTPENEIVTMEQIQSMRVVKYEKYSMSTHTLYWYLDISGVP